MSNPVRSKLAKDYTQAFLSLVDSNRTLEQELTKVTTLFKTAEQQRSSLSSENGQLKSKLQASVQISSEKHKELVGLHSQVEQLKQETKQLNSELAAKDELLNAKEEEIKRLLAKIAEYESSNSYLL